MTFSFGAHAFLLLHCVQIGVSGGTSSFRVLVQIHGAAAPWILCLEPSICVTKLVDDFGWQQIGPILAKPEDFRNLSPFPTWEASCVYLPILSGVATFKHVTKENQL